jgi:hypothetical protein
VASAQLVHQGVDGEGLAVRRLAARVVAGVDQVPVVVPLQVNDAVLADQGVQALEDVVVGARAGEVQHLLGADVVRPAAAGGQDPLGVGTGQVGVRVDHLRLHPQPELHAEPADVVDQRVQALRPDRLSGRGDVLPARPEGGGPGGTVLMRRSALQGSDRRGGTRALRSGGRSAGHGAATALWSQNKRGTMAKMLYGEQNTDWSGR